jgi:hypothetical protein
MKNNIKTIGIVIICFLLIYFTFNSLISKLTYAVGNERGYSRSLQESKQRGVFIKKLKYQSIPDSLKQTLDYVFFIEKGFSYGDNSVFKTDSLTGEDLKLPYQVIFGCKKPCKKYGGCDFDCNKKKYIRKDTMIALRQNENSNFIRRGVVKKHKYILFKENFINSLDTLIYDVIVDDIKNYKVDTIGQIKVWE